MLNIKGSVILIGTNVEGGCVYSEIVGVLDYYERLHVWDDPAGVRKLKMARLKGYVFSPKGMLDQEFDTTFDEASGMSKKCKIRFSDGTTKTSK